MASLPLSLFCSCGHNLEKEMEKKAYQENVFIVNFPMADKKEKKKTIPPYVIEVEMSEDAHLEKSKNAVGPNSGDVQIVCITVPIVD